MPDDLVDGIVRKTVGPLAGACMEAFREGSGHRVRPRPEAVICVVRIGSTRRRRSWRSAGDPRTTSPGGVLRIA